MDPDNGRDAFALEYLRARLVERVERVVLEHEEMHGGPVELDVSCVENEGSGCGHDALRRRVAAIVGAFHRIPLVRDLGVRIRKVTAFDSDGNGRVVVRVHCDYPDVQ